MSSLGETRPGFRSGYAALVGRPNVGKSTLTNRMVDQKVSIVSDKPQTTRHRITGVVTTDAYQLVLLDIPGFQKPRDQLTERMQKRVEEALSEVDVALWLLAADETVGRGDAFIADHLSNRSTPCVVALNKADAVQPAEVDRRRAEIGALQGAAACGEVMTISALEGTNVDALQQALADRLPLGPLYFPPGTVTDQPEELIMAELIREKAIRLTHEEVPHSLAVQILDVESRRGGDLLYVRAALLVERDSQRPIIVGQAGARVKSIGSEARREIEALLGTQIYLDLTVKVKKKWRKDEAMLERLGL